MSDKPKRRWFHFSIRDLIWLTVIVALAVGRVADHAQMNHKMEGIIRVYGSAAARLNAIKFNKQEVFVMPLHNSQALTANPPNEQASWPNSTPLRCRWLMANNHRDLHVFNFDFAIPNNNRDRKALRVAPGIVLDTPLVRQIVALVFESDCSRSSEPFEKRIRILAPLMAAKSLSKALSFRYLPTER